MQAAACSQHFHYCCILNFCHAAFLRRRKPNGPEISIIVPLRAWQPQQFEAVNLIAQAWGQMRCQSTQIPVPGFPAFLSAGGLTNGTLRRSAYIANPQRIDPQQLLAFPFLCESEARQRRDGQLLQSKVRFARGVRGIDLDQRERRKHVHEAQIVGADVPMLALYHPTEIDIYNKERLTDVVKPDGRVGQPVESDQGKADRTGEHH